MVEVRRFDEMKHSISNLDDDEVTIIKFMESGILSDRKSEDFSNITENKTYAQAESASVMIPADCKLKSGSPMVMKSSPQTTVSYETKQPSDKRKE